MINRQLDNHVVGTALTVALIFGASIAGAQETSQPSVDENGTLYVQSEAIPYSDLASPEAKRNYIDYHRAFDSLDKAENASPSIQEYRERLDRLEILGIERLRKAFAVNIAPTTIAGVQTDVIVPANGITSRNRNRLLINLHGGSMQVGARFGGQMESIPISSMGAIKVITVDYREAPEWHFPAASEDVAKVYGQLLKSYRPENIGIYGCSAGAALTGQSIAWFQVHGLPRPGAIGLFGWAPILGHVGDSNYIFSGGKSVITEESIKQDPYAKGVDWNDPLVSPVRDSSVLRKFPPTLLISGTRDVGLSPVVYTHSRLVDLGVKADLHIWEGTPHCSYAQPVVDPNVPETRQAWAVITRFFDEHLGTRAR
jgi:acetyl esterase/lipase